MLKQARTRLSLGLRVNYSGKRLPPRLRIISAPAESVTVSLVEKPKRRRVKGWQSGSPGHLEPSEPGNPLVALQISHRCIAQFSLLQCGRERIMLSKGKNERRCRYE